MKDHMATAVDPVLRQVDRCRRHAPSEKWYTRTKHDRVQLDDQSINEVRCKKRGGEQERSREKTSAGRSRTHRPMENRRGSHLHGQ